MPRQTHHFFSYHAVVTENIMVRSQNIHKIQPAAMSMWYVLSSYVNWGQREGGGHQLPLVIGILFMIYCTSMGLIAMYRLFEHDSVCLLCTLITIAFSSRYSLLTDKSSKLQQYSHSNIPIPLIGKKDCTVQWLIKKNFLEGVILRVKTRKVVVATPTHLPHGFW